MPDERQSSLAVAECLVRNDRDYFAAGARSRPVDGGTLRWMEGLQHLAAGCIVEPDQPFAAPDAWTAAAREIGASWVRIYSSDNRWQQRAKLDAAGFTTTTELAMARPVEARGGDPLPPPPDAIRPVTSNADWAAKLRLAAATIERPDGKQADAGEWTALERRKAESGYACFWLVEFDGTVCGTFGLAPAGPLLRIKNIAVHPEFRRSGVGSMLVAFAIEQARRQGLDWIGAFTFSDSIGRRLYARCGLEVVGAQSEWTLALPTQLTLARTSAVQSC